MISHFLFISNRHVRSSSTFPQTKSKLHKPTLSVHLQVSFRYVITTSCIFSLFQMLKMPYIIFPHFVLGWDSRLMLIVWKMQTLRILHPSQQHYILFIYVVPNIEIHRLWQAIEVKTTFSKFQICLRCTGWLHYILNAPIHCNEPTLTLSVIISSIILSCWIINTR